MHVTVSLVPLGATDVVTVRAAGGPFLYVGVNASVSLANLTIEGSTAVTEPLLVVEGFNSTLRLSGVEARYASGGMVVANESGILIADHTSFLNNSGPAGGAIRADGSARVNLTDCDLLHNRANASGGALSLAGTSRATLVRTNASRNRAGNQGGFVLLVDTSTLTARDGTFSHNSAAGLGGAIRNFWSTVNLVNVDLIDNYDDSTAGAVSIEGPGSIFRATNGNFTRNLSGRYGGLMRASFNAYVVLTDCIVSLNEALAGGAFYLETDAELHMSSSTVFGNIAIGRGGAFNVESGATLNLTTTTVRDNKAADGSAISCADASVSIDEDTTIGGTFFCNTPGLAAICKVTSVVEEWHELCGDLGRTDSGGWRYDVDKWGSALVLGLLLLLSCLIYVRYRRSVRRRRERDLTQASIDSMMGEDSRARRRGAATSNPRAARYSVLADQEDELV
jgi:predicted outer membrane repeat protein